MAKLDDEKIAEIREIYAHYDADDNGLIDYAEFTRLIDALDGDMSEEEMQIGFETIDSDSNHAIDFDEFIEWWADQ